MLLSGLKEVAQAAGVNIFVNRISSLGCFFFTFNPVTEFASAKESNADLFKKYYTRMLEQGIYLALSPFGAAFVSMAHGEKEIQKTIACAAVAFKGRVG